MCRLIQWLAYAFYRSHTRPLLRLTFLSDSYVRIYKTFKQFSIYYTLDAQIEAVKFHIFLSSLFWFLSYLIFSTFFRRFDLFSAPFFHNIKKCRFWTVFFLFCQQFTLKLSCLFDNFIMKICFDRNGIRQTTSISLHPNQWPYSNWTWCLFS